MPLYMFPKNTPLTGEIEQETGLGKMEFPTLVKFGPAARCYWNADEYAEKNRGAVVHGWQVHIFPRVYFALFHHAIVRASDGLFVDPTASPVLHEGYSAFFVDESIIPPRDYPEFVPNRYYPLGMQADVIAATAAVKNAHDAQMAINRRVMELLRDHSVPIGTTDPQILGKIPGLMALGAQHMKSRDAVQASTDLSEQIAKKYFR